MKIAKTAKADLALIFVTIIWGSTFAIVKKALAQVSPILFITLRLWIATALTVALMPGALRNMSLETFRRGSILASLLLGGFIFQTVGLRVTTASKSAFITSLSVLLVPILGFVLFGHRPRRQTIAGVALATVGLGLLTLETLELKFGRGDTLTFLCAVVFALHILFIGRYSPISDFRQLVILQMAVSAVVGSLAMPMLETPFLVPDVPFTLYLFITECWRRRLGSTSRIEPSNSQPPTAPPSSSAWSPYLPHSFPTCYWGKLLARRSGWGAGWLLPASSSLKSVATDELRRGRGAEVKGGKGAEEQRGKGAERQR